MILCRDSEQALQWRLDTQNLFYHLRSPIRASANIIKDWVVGKYRENSAAEKIRGSFVASDQDLKADVEQFGDRKPFFLRRLIDEATKKIVDWLAPAGIYFAK